MFLPESLVIGQVTPISKLTSERNCAMSSSCKTETTNV